MTTPCDIVAFVEERKGWSIGREEGVQHARWDRPVKAATVCWKATLDVMTDAGRRADDLIIGHESLYDPYDFDFNHAVGNRWREWSLNQRRRELLDRHDLGFLRLHSSVDRICIFTDFAEYLGFDTPMQAKEGGDCWLINECQLTDLVDHVKARMGLTALRVCAPNGMAQKVSHVGLLVGGCGLCPNVGFQERLVQAGCDVFIAGESDNYGFRYAQECGIPTIETSHELSEIPGLRHFSQLLAERFPDVHFAFVENTCPYKTL